MWRIRATVLLILIKHGLRWFQSFLFNSCKIALCDENQLQLFLQVQNVEHYLGHDAASCRRKVLLTLAQQLTHIGLHEQSVEESIHVVLFPVSLQQVLFQRNCCLTFRKCVARSCVSCHSRCRRKQPQETLWITNDIAHDLQLIFCSDRPAFST